MVKNNFEILLSYIKPILDFCGIFIDENGILRPFGDPTKSLTYKDEKNKLTKIIKYPRNIQEWKQFKDEETTEIFNPFVITRHIIFLADLIKNELTLLFSNEDECENDDDDLLIEFEDDDEIVQMEIPVELQRDEVDGKFIFSFVRFNKKTRFYETIVSAEHENMNSALYILMLETIKKFQPNEFKKTNETILLKHNYDKILSSIERVLKHISDEKKIYSKKFYEDQKDEEKLNNKDISGYDDEVVDIKDYNDEYFIFKSTIDGAVFEEFLEEDELIVFPEYISKKEMIKPITNEEIKEIIDSYEYKNEWMPEIDEIVLNS